METLRLFFAINLPDSLKDKIERKLKEIALPINVKYTPKDNLHLTVLFLGNILMEDVPQILKIGDEIFNQTPPLDLYATHISVAPNNNYARMIWLNFEKNEILENVKQKLERLLSNSGINFQKENREMKPHITLARFEPTHLEFKNVKFPLHFKTNEIFLMESRLQKPHAVYVPLKRFLLK
ncbi:MAG: RNA 2',3'-cyclic phosphodiesterase [Patescibacteria group bacterium]|jgi:2'-5' RNA ligase|nr:RNA 2',3'-cyclic phosphodiesterase [Patescibacteria group bacterium]